MAFLLPQTLPNGTAIEYGKVHHIVLFPGKTGSRAVIYWYPNKAASDTGKDPAHTEVVEWQTTIPFTIESMEVSNPVTICYMEMKNIPRFQAAQDV